MALLALLGIIAADAGEGALLILDLLSLGTAPLTQES